MTKSSNDWIKTEEQIDEIEQKGNAAYIAYLRTEEWAAKKARIKCNYHYCQRCKIARTVEIHHLDSNYSNLGNENLRELIGLCKGCHSFIHGYKELDPLDIWQKSEVSREYPWQVLTESVYIGIIQKRSWAENAERFSLKTNCDYNSHLDYKIGKYLETKDLEILNEIDFLAKYYYYYEIDGQINCLNNKIYRAANGKQAIDKLNTLQAGEKDTAT